TDNMTISGETIDYGPCAFMDTYDPKTVFSSIDKMGRYAYCNQPSITKWNLSRFAECLIPLINRDQDQAIQSATKLINTFEKKYEERWMSMMRKKLGLQGTDDKDKFLIVDLLTWMHQNKVDYTNTFCYLMDLKEYDDDIYKDNDFQNWKKNWRERLRLNDNNPEKYISLMRTVNPLVIPRNNKVEKALEFAEKGDYSFLKKIISILKEPYKLSQDKLDYQNPDPQQKNYQTFCGT
ncbi:protein adenylyltransferase SelO family protein, partial [Candidatus Pelagibacter sp.]|nr:protein adenylyltransferase SelO family protein [Candidatus Pelagibacter sp.]